MTIFFVLILSTIFFEGFVILCHEGNVSGVGKNPKTNVSSDNPELPYDLIADILFKAGYETTKSAANGNIRTEEVIKRIFETDIIVINPIPAGEHREIIELKKPGKRYLEIRNYGKLKRLFERFGENVRKIHIYYHYPYDPTYTMDDDMRREINHNIIKKYRKQLTELVMYTNRYPAPDNERVWEEISNENGEFDFPKVKKFKYTGHLDRKPFDVSQIFPKIEIFKSNGDIGDINCLKNVRNLKELSLLTLSIGEEGLVKIIANNKQIAELSICIKSDTTIKTVQSIAENLKNLKTLIVLGISDSTFFVPNHNTVYNLTSVTSFSFVGKTENLYKNLSFDMPNLEKLKVAGMIKGDDIAKFINRFHKMKTVYLRELDVYESISCIKHLIHVQEYVTYKFARIHLTYLESIFKNFDEGSSNLNRIKWLHFKESEYSLYQVKMNEVNHRLKESGKPTWQISHGYEEYEGENKHCLMFNRDA